MTSLVAVVVRMENLVSVADFLEVVRDDALAAHGARLLGLQQTETKTSTLLRH